MIATKKKAGSQSFGYCDGPQTTQRTIDAYEKNARRYADKFDNYQAYRDKIADFCRKHIPAGARVLDLGCGPGNNITTIVTHDGTCSITGIDLCPAFIRIAKERFPQFDFRQQDIRHLDVPHRYEVIIASFCIVHLTDDEVPGFLHTVANLLTDDGRLYLSYMNGDTCGYETTSFSEQEIFFNYYADSAVCRLLECNNLEVLETDTQEYPEPDGSVTTDTFLYAGKKS